MIMENKQYMKNKKRSIIVDIDGTLALMNGVRTPHEYNKVHLDKPNKPIIDLVHLFYNANKNKDFTIFIFTGRMNVYFDKPVKIGDEKFTNTKELSIYWLNKHLGQNIWNHIEIRRDKDFRSDRIAKKEMYLKICDEYKVEYVIDDRQQVIDMWRDDLGLTTLQVAKGDF